MVLNHGFSTHRGHHLNPGPLASFVCGGVQPLGFVKLPQVNLRGIKAENYGFKKIYVKFYLKPTVKLRKSSSRNCFTSSYPWKQNSLQKVCL